MDFLRDETVGKWKLSRLRAGMIEDLIEWLRPAVEAKLAFVRSVLPSLDNEAANIRVSQALDLQQQLEGLSMESPLFRETMKTSRGLIKMIHLRLLHDQPDATLDDAFDVLQLIGEQAERNGRGKPKKAAAEDADPKLTANVRETNRPNPPAPLPAGR